MPFLLPLSDFITNAVTFNMFYSSIVAEVFRIGRKSSSAAVFLTRVKILLRRMIKQGVLAEKLKKYLKRRTQSSNMTTKSKFRYLLFLHILRFTEFSSSN